MAAINAEWCTLKLSTSPGVCTVDTLPCNVTRDRIVTKTPQDLGPKKNNYLPEISCEGKHSVYAVKMTLPI